MENFLRRVLPDGGKYVVVSIADESGAREIRGLPDLASVVDAAQKLSMHPTNVYFAVGTYDHDRKSPRAKRALFVDLDAKSFGSKQCAVTDLSAFCKASSFPGPSIFVDSGRGIHAYWCFDRDLDHAAWRALADKLKAKCVELAFGADPTVTADVARIMRMPGTINQKSNTPCRVLKDTGVSYDPGLLLRSLLPRVSNSLASLAAAVGGGDLGTTPELASYPSVPYYATEIAEKCGVLKEALKTGGHEHTEPQWRHLLGLLTFTEDGDKLVHDISKGHEGYTEAGTDAKYSQVLKLKADGKLKPILCTTFATYKGSICAACPYNGHIKTPMVLGKLEATAYLPSGYRMADYSIQKMVKKGDGEIPDLWLDVFPYRISDVEAHDPGQGGALQVKMVLSSKTKITKVTFPHTVLASITGGEFAMALSEAHLFIDSKQMAELKHIMTNWLRKMTDIKTSMSIELTGLGWGKLGGQDAFVAGPHVYTADGKKHDFYAPDPAMLRNYKPKGVIDAWKIAANAIARDPRQEAVCTLLTAFAAPLIGFTGAKGITFSLYSAESGTGKSSILRTAQATWGHPTLGMAMVDDTQLSVINKLGFLNTIPAYWDELRSGDTLVNFVKMIFTLGQGREKSRLTNTIQQRSTGTWDTLVTIASNERIVDHVDTYIKNTDAGRLRLFEVSLPNLVAPDAVVTRAFSKLENNYGHAGIIYGQYLATHRIEVEKLVHDIQDMLKKKVSVGANERYWVAFVTAILASGTIVNRAGLLNIDLQKLTVWLLEALKQQQGGVVENYKTPAQAAIGSVFSFIDAHRNKMLLVEGFNETGLNKYGNILTPQNQQPRDEIVVLKAVKDKKIRLKESVWKQYVSTVMKHSPTTLATELLALGVKFIRQGMDGGLQQGSNARVRVLEIDLTSPAFSQLLDDDQ